jgi:hypothetical protein
MTKVAVTAVLTPRPCDRRVWPTATGRPGITTWAHEPASHGEVCYDRTHADFRWRQLSSTGSPLVKEVTHVSTRVGVDGNRQGHP